MRPLLCESRLQTCCRNVNVGRIAHTRAAYDAASCFVKEVTAVGVFLFEQAHSKLEKASRGIVTEQQDAHRSVNTSHKQRIGIVFLTLSTQINDFAVELVPEILFLASLTPHPALHIADRCR